MGVAVIFLPPLKKTMIMSNGGDGP